VRTTIQPQLEPPTFLFPLIGRDLRTLQEFDLRVGRGFKRQFLIEQGTTNQESRDANTRIMALRDGDVHMDATRGRDNGPLS